jgi:hypothetical protein
VTSFQQALSGRGRPGSMAPVRTCVSRAPDSVSQITRVKSSVLSVRPPDFTFSWQLTHFWTVAFWPKRRRLLSRATWACKRAPVLHVQTGGQDETRRQRHETFHRTGSSGNASSV